jgi:hypothetical protein
MTNCAVGHR